MSLTIYYSFKSSENLATSGVLEKTAESWNKLEYEGSETWSWYEPQVEKKFLKKSIFTYEGSTRLMDSTFNPEAVMSALNILTNIRRHIPSTEWSVNLDDLELPWDESVQKYHITGTSSGD